MLTLLSTTTLMVRFYGIWGYIKNPAKHLKQVEGIPPELVKSYTVEALVGKEWVEVARKENNITRFVSNQFDEVKTKAIRINLLETYGEPTTKMFEVRCY